MSFLNRIAGTGLLAMVAQLVLANASIGAEKAAVAKASAAKFAAEKTAGEKIPVGKITCIAETPYKIVIAEKDKAPPEPSEAVMKAISKEFSKQLEKTGKFEVETREQSELPPGEKFKTARFLVIADVTLGYPKMSNAVDVYAKVVNIISSELVAFSQSSAPVNGEIVWPKTAEEATSEKFKESEAGKALYTALEKVANDFAGKSASIAANKP